MTSKLKSIEFNGKNYLAVLNESLSLYYEFVLLGEITSSKSKNLSNLNIALWDEWKGLDIPGYGQQFFSVVAHLFQTSL